MIDPDRLLVPIPGGGAPWGVDPRNPNFHPAFTDARSAWRQACQREDATDPGNPPDWPGVVAQCQSVLTATSKDLEVVVWLAEAAIHDSGIDGLTAAGQLLAGLADQFWDGLFPSPFEDETDVTPEEARLRPPRTALESGSRLLAAIQRVPLFTLNDGKVFSLAACQASKSLTAASPADRTKRLSLVPEADRGAAPETRLWPDLLRDAKQVSTAGPARAAGDAAAALEAWREAAAAIGSKAGNPGFSLGALPDVLADIQRVLNEVAPDPADGASPGPDPGSLTPSSETPRAGTALSSRDDALARVEEIAAFFRRTEPHSPVAFTLEEAVRRARLSWPDWLAEAVPDPQQRSQVLNRLGLRSDSD